MYIITYSNNTAVTTINAIYKHILLNIYKNAQILARAGPGARGGWDGFSWVGGERPVLTGVVVAHTFKHDPGMFDTTY